MTQEIRTSIQENDAHSAQNQPSESQHTAMKPIEESCGQILLEMANPESAPDDSANKIIWRKYAGRPFSWKLKVLAVRAVPRHRFVVKCSCAKSSPLSIWEVTHGHGEGQAHQEPDLQTEKRKIVDRILKKHLDPLLYVEIKFASDRKDFVASLQPGNEYEFNGTLDDRLSMFALTATDR